MGARTKIGDVGDHGACRSRGVGGGGAFLGDSYCYRKKMIVLLPLKLKVFCGELLPKRRDSEG